jgi:hypothetical protein
MRVIKPIFNCAYSHIPTFLLCSDKYLSNATERRSTWISAKNTCDVQSSLPQFTDREVEQVFRNFSKDFHNFSIWLGLQKNILNKNDCISTEVENDTKLTDFTLEICYSVDCLNITNKEMETPCDELHHPLCVQRKSQPKGIVPRRFIKSSVHSKYEFCLRNNCFNLGGNGKEDVSL